MKTADRREPLLGLFTPGTFPTRSVATPATVRGENAAPVTCAPNPARLASDLSLAALTTTAIPPLDKPENGTGFFLHVEGASTDEQDHAASACGQLGETLDFDDAVRAALVFAKRDGDRLAPPRSRHGSL